MSRHGLRSARDAAFVLVQEAPGFEELDCVALVQDLQGRVRIAWRPKEQSDGPDVGEVEQALKKELGGWFSGPILVERKGRPTAASRVARKVLELAEPASEQGWELTHFLTHESVKLHARWRYSSRTLSKEHWLSSKPAEPIWPSNPGAPTLVAFHSFKGGVGRSTTLALVAVHLARRGHSVVCIDLDLESPGLHRVFGVQPGAGVLAALARLAVGERLNFGGEDGDDTVGTFRGHGAEVSVLPAGLVDDEYIETLGRLDLSTATSASRSASDLLRRLLHALRALKPHFILLDNRSGLSDLAGFALASLAHIDVFVARGNEQGCEGLRVTMPRVARGRTADEVRFVVAHAMVPLPVDGDVAQTERARLRQVAWENFPYPEGSDRPGPTEPYAPHVPWPLPDLDEVKRAEAIGRVSASTVNDERFAALADRILDLADVRDASGPRE